MFLGIISSEYFKETSNSFQKNAAICISHILTPWKTSWHLAYHITIGLGELIFRKASSLLVFTTTYSGLWRRKPVHDLNFFAGLCIVTKSIATDVITT